MKYFTKSRWKARVNCSTSFDAGASIFRILVSFLMSSKHKLRSATNKKTTRATITSRVYFCRMVDIKTAAPTSMLGRSLRLRVELFCSKTSNVVTFASLRDFRKSGLLPLMIKLLTSLFARCVALRVAHCWQREDFGN